MASDVAILCSGGSCAEFLRTPRVHSLYLGVNRMAEDFPCDWWIFGDGVAFEWYTARKRAGRPPGICTTDPILDRLKRSENVGADRLAMHEWRTLQTLATTCPRDLGGYSLTLAMILAESLGANMITLYGSDWKGRVDYDGAEPRRGGRDSYRWQNERHTVSLVVKWLSERGVAVRRYLAGGTFENMNTAAGSWPDPAIADPVPFATPEDPVPRTASHTMRFLRSFRFGTETIPAGTVAAVIELHKPFTLGFLSRAMQDGIIAKRE